MTRSAREQLDDRLAENAEQIRGLERQYDEMVAATLGANGDDEHDPEGSTIAFERQQVVALIDQSRRTRSELERALTSLHDGTYGECERCGRAIGAGRLEARPNARTCITCAS